MFFLRGDYFDSDYLREAKIFNKVFEVQSHVQAINILGYVLNKPIANFDQLPAEQLEKMLWSGKDCFIQAESRKQLEKVVRQMKSFRFELIPLMVVTNPNDAKKIIETVLIKVHETRFDYSYVDISGRIYSSFRNFLVNNILPLSILCYPKNEIVSFDAAKEINTECCVVGRANAQKGGMDALVGLIGAAGAVGTIFATGGLAMPFAFVVGGTALYTTGRSIENLVDASVHGKSLNPFEDAEARNNWLMMSANLLTFASLGVTGLAAKASRFKLADRIILGVSAGVNAVTIVDSVAYMANNWQQMTTDEKIKMASAVCFCFREVISLTNAKRLIRTSVIDGLCKVFKDYAVSFVEGAISVGKAFIDNCKRLFNENEQYASTALNLIQALVRDSIHVTISDDFWTIHLFGFEYKMRNIISMTGTELNKFLYMLQGISNVFKDGFSILRRMFGDGPIANVVFKRAEEAGGNRAHYGNAINELIEVFMLVRRISNDFSILTDAKLKIGGGHCFTLASAYRTFVKKNGLSLLQALMEMNPREIKCMNSLRAQFGCNDANIFAFITHSSISSSQMLDKIRFLLNVFEICTGKSLRITDINPEKEIVEIESEIRVGLDQFYKSDYPSYLIDPKLYQICQPALKNHREFIETIWKNTCLGSKRFDRAFEKLTIMEIAFKSYSPTTIENVISYASSMECPDFSRFTNHVAYALKTMDNLARETGLDEVAVNEKLFPDSAVLRSRFLELTLKVKKLSLDGYCPIDDSLAADPSRLIEMIKELAGSARLRFGTIENGACHMNMYPLLRIGSEIVKFNRYIKMKKFHQQEVQLIYDGKWMVYLGNEQLHIVIGVVRGLGAYIDTFSITQ